MSKLNIHFSSGLVETPFHHKKNYTNLINLASNELQHEKLYDLYAKFIQSLSNNFPAHKYPHYDSYRKYAAKITGTPHDDIAFSPGSDLCISLLLSHFTKCSGKLIMQYPNYYNYARYADMNNIEVIKVNFLGLSDHEFLQSFISTIESTPPTLIIITNPDPYLGRTYELNLIEKIVEKSDQNDHIVVIDEAHSAFSNLSHYTLLHKYNNLLILSSFSKTYGAAGIRLALAIGMPKIVENIKKLGIENSVSVYSLKFLEFISLHTNEFKIIRDDIVNLRNTYIQNLKDVFPKWKVYPSRSIFIPIDVAHEDHAKKITKSLLNNKIAIRHLNSLVPELNSFIRIAIGTDLELQKMYKVLSHFYKEVY